jgi:CysZ protein
MLSVKPSLSGFQYFLQGFDLIRQPKLRPFVLIPLLVNLILFSVSFYFLFQQIDVWLLELEASLDWLSWLVYIIKPLAFIVILLIFGFFFGAIANIIAAPFNGLLAEQTELLLNNKPLPDMSIKDIILDIPRVLTRELKKIKYYIPRAIALLLLFFIPVVGQTVAPVLWFIFTAWMLAIQYADYTFDNNKVGFDEMRSELSANRMQSLSFGSIVALCQSIPIVNFIVMPIAVCGATAMCVSNNDN